MGNEWPETTVGAFSPFIYGKGLPERARNESGTVPVFGSNGVVGMHDSPYVNEPGIVVGRKGTVGAVHYSPNPFWPIDTTFYVTTDKSRDLRFTYYLLRSLPLDRMNSDSAVPGLNRDAAHSVRIRVPCLEGQQRIADVLGKLDDKIEVNRRMNETLEKMAGTIFKKWFIDFDPVHAKADLPTGRQEAALPSAERGNWFVYALECEGGSVYIGHTDDLARRFDQHVSGRGAEWTKTHPPKCVAYWEEFHTQKEAVLREKKLKTGSGREWLKAEIARQDASTADPTALPAEIADLFPDSFEDSAPGPIPKEWKVMVVDDVTEIVKGRSYKSTELQPSDVALVTLKSFLRGGGYREDGLKPYTGKYKPEQVVQPGEIVVAMTDVTQNADVIGRPAIVMPDARHGVLVASLDTSIVRPTSANVSTPFFYGLFRTEVFRAHTYAHSSGTTVLHLAKNAIPSFQFACPTVPVQQTFLFLVDPLRARQMTIHRQNRRLASLRDTLLPKLLSGEIELPVAESVAEETGA